MATAALRCIVDRWETADKANGGVGFDEYRSGLAWAMYTDAKAALEERWPYQGALTR